MDFRFLFFPPFWLGGKMQFMPLWPKISIYLLDFKCHGTLFGHSVRAAKPCESLAEKLCNSLYKETDKQRIAIVLGRRNKNYQYMLFEVQYLMATSIPGASMNPQSIPFQTFIIHIHSFIHLLPLIYLPLKQASC